jgi:hypothetical protein
MMASLQPDEDLNHNGRNDLVGFHDPIRSPLALLERGDPDTDNAFLPFLESPSQISELRAGDFNGDGLPELAVLMTNYTQGTFDAETGQRTGVFNPYQTVGYMQPDLEMNNLTGKVEYTGQFYLDFGTKREEFPDPNGGPPIIVPPMPLFPLYFVAQGGFGQGSIEATALSTVAGSESTYDVILAGNVGNSDNSTDGSGNPGLATVDYSNRAPGLLTPSPLLAGQFLMGAVDTNRGNQTNIVAFSFQAATALDYDLDGLADAIAVSSSPDGFLVGIKGDGTGFGVQTSGDGDNNSGNFLADPPYTGPLGGNEVGIKSVDVDGDGNPNEFVVLGSGGSTIGIFDAYVEGAGQQVSFLYIASSPINPANIAFDFPPSRLDDRFKPGILYRR